MKLSENLIDKGYFQNLKKHISHNYQIAEFYDNLYQETGDFSYHTKSKAIDLCCEWWDMDLYRMQNVKDIKRVNLCRDKFCFNCQSMLALKRQGKFGSQLDSFRNDYMIAHVIITVPNCEGEELAPLLDRMYKKFPYMMRYLKGQKKFMEWTSKNTAMPAACGVLKLLKTKKIKHFTRISIACFCSAKTLI